MALINNWHIDPSWTLFLDRDGVINRRFFGAYVTKIEDFHFEEDVPLIISKLSTLFGRIIVITNQQGVAKKIMSVGNLNEIHNYMLDEIHKMGGRIDMIQIATNMKGEANDRRKPSPAMAHEAQQKFPEIEFQKAIMIGDTNSDLLFAKNLGMKSVLVRSEEKVEMEADLIVDSLKEFYNLLQ